MRKIIKEFLELGYKENKPPLRPSDVEIENLVIGRIWKDGYQVYYLHSGTSITIPWKWIDFFGQLFVHSGHKVFETLPKKNDNVEKLIYWMTKLQEKLMTKNNILEVLGTICKIGTTAFRKEYPEFPPIQYSSRIKQIEI